MMTLVKGLRWIFPLWLAACLAVEQPGLRDFEKRVAEYVKLHKKLDSDLPRLKPTHTEAEIVDHQHSLASKIQEARTQAAQGDILTPDTAAEFRRLIATTMQGAEAVRIRKSLQRAEPVKLSLRVNDTYPEKLPLQSTPPTLLLNLPKLPEQLDYRVIGHSLVLRDVRANLIVDFIPNAIP